MLKELQRDEWPACFDDFNRRNRWRPTRIDLVDDEGACEVESGLPFWGVALEAEPDAPSVQLLLGYDGDGPRHLTYTIKHVRRVALASDGGASDDRLEFEDDAGERRVLSFERLPDVNPIYLH